MRSTQKYACTDIKKIVINGFTVVRLVGRQKLGASPGVAGEVRFIQHNNGDYIEKSRSLRIQTVWKK